MKEKEYEYKEVKSEPKAEIKEAKLVQVPTQFEPAIELEGGEVVSMTELMVRIYNSVEKIRRAVC